MLVASLDSADGYANCAATLTCRAPAVLDAATTKQTPSKPIEPNGVTVKNGARKTVKPIFPTCTSGSASCGPARSVRLLAKSVHCFTFAKRGLLVSFCRGADRR